MELVILTFLRIAIYIKSIQQGCAAINISLILIITLQAPPNFNKSFPFSLPSLFIFISLHSKAN